MLIDTSIFVLLKNAIKKDGWLELPAYGNSMFPFIRQGDRCRFVPCEPSTLIKGDIILFYSYNDQLIAHRLANVKIINNQQLFQLKGDSNLGYDQLIEEDRLLGKLVIVQKKNSKLTPNHFISKLYGKMILSIPALSCIIRKYVNRKLQY
jgi:signal peptidase I